MMSKILGFEADSFESGVYSLQLKKRRIKQNKKMTWIFIL